jgi:hypothetical protein
MTMDLTARTLSDLWRSTEPVWNTWAEAHGRRCVLKVNEWSDEDTAYVLDAMTEGETYVMVSEKLLARLHRMAYPPISHEELARMIVWAVSHGTTA